MRAGSREGSAVPHEPRCASRLVRGVRVDVVNTRDDVATHAVFARLDGALALIARHEPRRFARLRRDLARIEVRRFPCRAAFFPETRTCLIELTFAGLGQFSDAQVGASIVHEGMHARLFAMGVAGRPERSAREERVCRLAELEFGCAVPDGAAVIARARASLALSDPEVAPTIDWGLAQRRIAAADARGRRPDSAG